MPLPLAVPRARAYISGQRSCSAEGRHGVGQKGSGHQALIGPDGRNRPVPSRVTEATTMDAAYRTVPPTHTQVAGIAVPDSAIAHLALLLSDAGKSALAAYVGAAWDQCRPELPLTDRDCGDIVAVLQPGPRADLQPLYEALRDRITHTQRQQEVLRDLRRSRSLHEVHDPLARPDLQASPPG